LCIQTSAFERCSSLLSISLPSSLRRIARAAFRNCTSLSIITFAADAKLSCVDQFAFQECSSLAVIWIPAALEVVLRESGRVLKIGVPDGTEGS
jgi:hypothetical protein